LASRLATVIQDEHNIKPVERYFWTDSTTVLHWLRNENRSYKIFIANRLGVIDTLTKIKEAETLLLRYSQQKSFPTECKALSENRAVYSTSRLRTLNPYSDKRGEIRVGGRIGLVNMLKRPSCRLAVLLTGVEY
jgi:hypothetical protein